MQTTIRKATSSDADGIARVHVESWQSTYPGILPEETLGNLSIENRAKAWQKTLQTLPEDHCIVVCENHNEIVGFACGGPERGMHADYSGEVYAIYILEKAQGLGNGQRMLQNVAQSLLDFGLDSMLIWVAKENDSRFFYEALGGLAVAENSIEIHGTRVEEIGFGWLDVRSILE